MTRGIVKLRQQTHACAEINCANHAGIQALDGQDSIKVIHNIDGLDHDDNYGRAAFGIGEVFLLVQIRNDWDGADPCHERLVVDICMTATACSRFIAALRMCGTITPAAPMSSTRLMCDRIVGRHTNERRCIAQRYQEALQSLQVYGGMLGIDGDPVQADITNHLANG